MFHYHPCQAILLFLEVIYCRLLGMLLVIFVTFFTKQLMGIRFMVYCSRQQ